MTKPIEILTLERLCIDDMVSIGKLYHKGQFVCYTVERPWLDNKHGISCIPPGLYDINPFNSEHHPNCFSLENENLGVSLYGDTTRTAILIHVANFPSDVEGCIGPGLSLHHQRWGVLNSREAMGNLRRLINTDIADWKLKIKHAGEL